MMVLMGAHAGFPLALFAPPASPLPVFSQRLPRCPPHRHVVPPQGYMLTCVSYPQSDVHFTVIEEDELP